MMKHKSKVQTSKLTSKTWFTFSGFGEREGDNPPTHVKPATTRQHPYDVPTNEKTVSATGKDINASSTLTASNNTLKRLILHSTRKTKQFVAFGLLLLAGALTTPVSAQTVVNICDRTDQVEEAILDAISPSPTCDTVTATQLTGVDLLDLFNTGISTLRANDFSGLTNLEFLYLNDNSLSALPTGVFDDLTNLTELDLGDNMLSTLPAGVFDDLGFLFELDLSDNSLSALPAGVFDGLTDLDSLDFNTNNLSTLPAGVFDDLTSLTELDLSDNSLSTLPADVFDNLGFLVELDLEGNSLSTLPAGVFDGLTDLEFLYLNDNSLSALPTDVFDNLEFLFELDLGDNMLSTLPAGVFDDLTSLEGLDLEGNSLSTLPAGVFDGLTSLGGLNLGDNMLSALDAGVFNALTSLEELDLEGNSLSTLPAGVFNALTSLEGLDLGDNMLSALDAGVFNALTSLEELALVGNTFTTPLPADIFLRLPSDAVIQIDLSSIDNLPDVALTVGGMTTIDVASAFISRADDTGMARTLSFTLTPADTAVATASESSGVLTITGAGMGTTTVSVTARDGESGAVGMRTQTIAVTVTGTGILAFDEATGDTLATPVVAEASGTDMLYVQLASAPASDVILSVTSSDTNEGTVTPAALTFSTTNWNTRQALTVTAVNDNVDRDDSFTVDFAVTTGDGGDYTSSLTLPSVTVTVADDDTAGIDAYDMATGGSEISAITTSEAGDTATFYIELASEPTADVILTASGIDSTEHTLTTSTTLTFTPTNWFTRQAVTFEGVNDDDADGDQTYDVTLTASGGGYDGIVAIGSATNTDDDTMGIEAYDMATGGSEIDAITTSEAGDSVTFYAALANEPTGTVTVTIDGIDTTEHRLTTSTTLTFTTTNWFTRQAVTLTGVDDDVADGDQTYEVTLRASGGGYDGVMAIGSITNTDDDTLGIDVYDALTAGSEINAFTTITTSEAAGNTATFYVELTSEPTDTVTVTIDGLDTTEHTLTTPASGTLTFDSTNWNTSRQAITITGVDDNVVDGDQDYFLTLTASGGGYDGVAGTLHLENTDDDTAALTIVSTTIAVNEDAGTATLEMTLTPEVTATSGVTVQATTTDGTARAGEDYTAITNQLVTFTAGSTTQTLDIAISDDNIAEGNETFTVMLSALTAPTGVTIDTADTATVTITDDDTAPTTIDLNVDPLTVAETAGDTEITVTATLGDGSASLPTDTVVTLTISGTATITTDYTLTMPSSTITIAALATSGTKTFMIDPVDDTKTEGGETVEITGTAGSFTVNPATLNIVEAGVSVYEAMTGGTPINTVTIAEASTDTLYAQLASQPASDITLSVTSSDTDEGTVDTATLTFTNTNWATRRAVIVTAVDDNIFGSSDSFTVDFAVTAGDGANYTTSLPIPSVTVTVTDDDEASDTINLSISPDSIQETAGATEITVTATLGGAAFASGETVVEVILGAEGTASPNTDYMLSTSTGTITLPTTFLTMGTPTITITTITIPELTTRGMATFMITPEADDVNDNGETVVIEGEAGSLITTVNSATLTIVEFSREDQQAIEQVVAAQASGITQVVTEQIGSRLASRSSGSTQGGQSLSAIDWQDRLAKFTYEGLQRLDSEADMSLDWLLRAAGGNGQLLMPLGAESLTLWASGGHLSTKGDGVGTYDGDINSFILGVDTDFANDWVAGMAISYSDSEIDYTMNGAGETEQTLYGFHPYLSRIISKGLTLWATGGYGFGDVDFSHTNHGQATSDVTQWMAAGGLEKQIITNTPWQGALRVKGLWGNAEVDATRFSGGGNINKIGTDFWRARMESEMGYHFPLSGGSLRPYALIGGRLDHNDAIVSGDEWHVDVGGGVEILSGNAFALNISVHTQVTDGDTEQDSIVGTGSLTYDIGHDRQGLQMTLSRPLNHSSWDQHSFNALNDTSSSLSSAPLTSELAYGWTVRPLGLKGAVQTYTQTRFDSGDRHYAVGLELAINTLTLNFETGYHDHTSLNSGETDNTGLESMFKTKIRW